MDVLTPKKLVELLALGALFVCQVLLLRIKSTSSEKITLDIAERIVNDLLTGLRGLPSWFPVATYFSLLSNFNFNEHIFERFTVDLSLETFFSKTIFHMASFWEFYTWTQLKQKLLQETRFLFVTSNR